MPEQREPPGCLLRQVSKLPCFSKGRKNSSHLSGVPPKNGVSETSPSHLRSTSSLVFLHKNNLCFQVLVYSYPSLLFLLCLSTELILLQYLCHSICVICVRLDSGQWFSQNFRPENLCARVWALEATPRTCRWSLKRNCAQNSVISVWEYQQGTGPRQETTTRVPPHARLRHRPVPSTATLHWQTAQEPQVHRFSQALWRSQGNSSAGL